MLARTTHTFGPLFHLGDGLTRLFGPLTDGDFGTLANESPTPSAWLPAVDVSAGKENIVVRAEVPGVSPDNLEVTVTGRVLTIAGEKRESEQGKDEGVHYAERRFGSFRRSIKLPTDVETDSITASHKDGVLEIRLDKSKALLPKRIPVEVAGN